MSLRHSLAAGLAALLALALAVTGSPSALADSAQPGRLAGPDRFETATAISGSRSAGTAPRVSVANSRDFPDGLSGGAMAAHDGSPLLLVDANRIPAATAAEIARLAPQEIIVLDGQGSIGPVVVDALADHARVTHAGRARTATRRRRRSPGSPPERASQPCT